MTNLEWLHSLEPKELSEWFAAEHVDARTCQMEIETSGGAFTCSECGALVLHSRDPKFCPDCGAEVDSYA